MSKSDSPWRQESYHDLDGSGEPRGKKRRRSDSEESQRPETHEAHTEEDRIEDEIHEEGKIGVSGFCDEEENKDDDNDNHPGHTVTPDGGTVYEQGSAEEIFDRVDDPLFWGPYLSERQWGTVREDYSDDHSSWEHTTHDDAISHAYASGEDGLLGVSDRFQLLCASLALWNGKDPILKERLFGLTGIEGNHGEDVKELYYYLDNIPDHSYMRALYKYPQGEFPYQQLREENKKRSFKDPEFEILDTGVFDNGHWDVSVEYAKTDNLSLVCRITAINCGHDTQTLHILPQFYLRNTCRVKEPLPNMPRHRKVLMSAAADGSVNILYHLGNWCLQFLSSEHGQQPTLLFTNNASDFYKGHDPESSKLFTKNSFHRYIVNGVKEAVNPSLTGTKCGALYVVTVPAGDHACIYWKIESPFARTKMNIGHLRQIFLNKISDAEAFYQSIMLGNWSAQEVNIARQSIAGLLWSKQYFCFDVRSWMEDYKRHAQHSQKTPRKVRNSGWLHIKNHDILLMPDKWEFPWYAGWDLAIQAMLYARFDVSFAKQQLLIFLSDRYMHPRGLIPGCEFDLGEVNPPLQAWACLHIYSAQGKADTAFLKRCFHRLLLNYGWWCSLEYHDSRTYGRGFLGMDNVSVVDRSGQLPPGWSLVQADCTGWMACLCLWLLKMAVELGQRDPTYIDLLSKFLTHFLDIAVAINKPIDSGGLWHEEDQFFYDVFHTCSGPKPIRLRSIAGLVPLLACTTINLRGSALAAAAFSQHMAQHPQHIINLNESEVTLSLLPWERVKNLLEFVFNENEFLSPYGIRSLSKVYASQPYEMEVGEKKHSVHYAPGESDCGDFGGNSNWRGPVWLCMNYLLLECMDCYHLSGMHTSSPLLIHHPTLGPSNPASLPVIIGDLEKRLLAIFLPDSHGKRPLHGQVMRYAMDPKWRHLVLFYEYFHAETGRGCGASHQTGWTALVIEIMHRHHNPSIKKTY